MARGNQRENAREAAQKKLGGIVCADQTSQTEIVVLIPMIEEQEHQDWFSAGRRQGERCRHHAEKAGRR
jgi:hypothetical protein